MRLTSYYTQFKILHYSQTLVDKRWNIKNIYVLTKPNKLNNDQLVQIIELTLIQINKL